jgi:hypothetical protein
MKSGLRLSGRLSARLASLVEAGLLTCKLAGILTYFQTKVKRIHRRGRKEKFSHELTLIGTNFFDADFADYAEGFGRHAFFGKAFSRSELL